MTISNEKLTELSKKIHDEIMDARLKIWAKRNDKNVSIAEIDDILSKLCWSAPQKAVQYFTDIENNKP